MDMMPTISSIQNSVVLPYNVVPTTLTIAENLMVAGLHGNHRALFSQVNGAVTLNGSAITNPALQGRIAYVTATQGEVTYDDPSTAIPSQRIYIQVVMLVTGFLNFGHTISPIGTGCQRPV